MSLIGQTPDQAAEGVTLQNWQVAPQLGWSFQHVAELFPTATISRVGGRGVAPLAIAQKPVGEYPFVDFGGVSTTVEIVMTATETDGWIVWCDGVVIAEHYPRGMRPGTQHLLMSVSKSLIGSVCGALVEQGVLRLDDLVTDHVPELGMSGYSGATVRHLLDMRSGIAFSEDYLDPNSEVRRLEQAIGWAPRVSPDAPRTMRQFLTALRGKAPHGGPFEYRSGETDVLGWVCEAAAKMRMPALLEHLLWSRLGCEYDANIGVDSEGTGMFDGGISAALPDLVRFGVMVLQGGIALTGERVLSQAWVDDTFAGGPDSGPAFAASPSETLMPGGMYRNQFWSPYQDRTVVLALGIHGQMLYVNRRAGMVAAKFSSWPTPQDPWKLFSTLAAFDAIAARSSS